VCNRINCFSPRHIRNEETGVYYDYCTEACGAHHKEFLNSQREATEFLNGRQAGQRKRPKVIEPDRQERAGLAPAAPAKLLQGASSSSQPSLQRNSCSTCAFDFAEESNLCLKPGCDWKARICQQSCTAEHQTDIDDLCSREPELTQCPECMSWTGSKIVSMQMAVHETDPAVDSLQSSLNAEGLQLVDYGGAGSCFLAALKRNADRLRLQQWRRQMPRWVRDHVTKGTDVLPWLSTQEQAMRHNAGCESKLTIHEHICDGLRLPSSTTVTEMLDHYREHINPVTDNDYTDNYLESFDFPLLARFLEQPVHILQTVQDAPRGDRLKPVRFGAYLQHSLIGGADLVARPAMLLRDDPDMDSGANSHYLSIEDVPLDPKLVDAAKRSLEIGQEPQPEQRFDNFAQTADQLPIDCSAHHVDNCLGLVTAEAVINGQWCLSHVLPGKSSSACLRFTCRACFEALNGASAQALVASTEDLAAVIESKTCDVPHQKSPRPANFPANPTAGRKPLVFHPAGPIANTDAADWFEGRHGVEILQRLLASAPTVTNTPAEVMAAALRQPALESPPLTQRPHTPLPMNPADCAAWWDGKTSTTLLARLSAAAPQMTQPPSVDDLSLPPLDLRGRLRFLRRDEYVDPNTLAYNLQRFGLQIDPNGPPVDDRLDKQSRYPFVRPDEVRMKSNHTNNCVPASNEYIKAAPDVELARAPTTEFQARPVVRQFVETDTLKFPLPWQLFRDGRDGKRSKIWDDIKHMSKAIRDELRRLERNQKTMKNPKSDHQHFDFSVLDDWGGRDGYLIPEDQLNPDYSEWHWSLERHLQAAAEGVFTVPCDPVHHETINPADFCNLELPLLFRVAEEIQFGDMQIVGELCTEGLYNRSHLDKSSVLQPNYANFFKYMLFNSTKRAEKLSFQPPRLSGPFKLPPFIPFRVVPKSVVEQMSDGRWKYRATSDYGAPRDRSFHEWDMDDFDMSVNGGIDLSNPEEFPSFTWATVSKIARQTAIMAQSGLKMTKFKADFSSYYETLPRAGDNFWCQIQLCSSEGFDIDTQGVFGNREMPALSSRVSTFYLHILKDRLQRLQWAWLERWMIAADKTTEKTTVKYRDQLQAVLERYGDVVGPSRRPPITDVLIVEEADDVPIETRISFVEWMTFRHSLGPQSQFSGEFWCMDVYIDDSFGSCFSFAAHAFEEMYRMVWPEYGIQLADGTAGTSNKTFVVPGAEELITLGMNIVMPNLVVDDNVDTGTECGILEVPDEKVSQYSALGARIKQIAEANGDTVPTPVVERFMGQMLWCCSAVPSIKGDWQLLLNIFQHAARARQVTEAFDSELSPEARVPTRGHTPVASAARFIIDSMLLKLREENGVCIFPREGPAGEDNVPVVWRFFDAALNSGKGDHQDDPFIGFGGWQYIEGDDEILFYCAPWTDLERQRLEINALELINVILGEELFRPSTDFRADIIDACDNINAVAHILNGAKAKAAPLRAIYRKRMELVLALEASGQAHLHRHIGVHVLREFNTEADYLSRGMIDKFQAAINKRFGRQMRFTRISVADARMRKTSTVLRAAVADKTYKLAKERELERMRLSTATPPSTEARGPPMSLSQMAIGRAVSVAASTAFLCKPTGQFGVPPYHGTAFKFQDPTSNEVWMGTAAHCLKKCKSCERCKVCVKPGLLYRLVPSLPRNGGKFDEFVDCAKCQSCKDCANISSTFRLQFTEGGGRCNQLRIQTGSVLRNNKADLAIFKLDAQSTLATRDVPALQICMDDATGAQPALTIVHHRAPLLEHCIASSEKIGADAASIRYLGSEPYGFGPGASGAPGVIDAGTLLSVHYAGASAINALGGLRARQIPGFGVRATLLIPLMDVAKSKLSQRQKRQRL
jgi:hypothetical protein